MLYADSGDSQKIQDKLTEVLDPKKVGKFVFVNINKLYNECALAELRKAKFAAEVNDALSSNEAWSTLGVWLFTEWEGSTYVFVRLSEPTKGSSHDLIRSMVDADEARIECGGSTVLEF